MDLDSDVYTKLANIEWFSRCGMEPLDQFSFEAERVATRSAAVSGAQLLRSEFRSHFLPNFGCRDFGGENGVLPNC